MLENSSLQSSKSCHKGERARGGACEGAEHAERAERAERARGSFH